MKTKIKLFIKNLLSYFIFLSIMTVPLSCKTMEGKTDINNGLLLIEEFIFEEAPFPYCHTSTIEETPDGLIAAWCGGTREMHEDVEIWVSRKVGDRWATPVSVADGIQHIDKRYPCWNPVLYRVPDGPLMLFYKVGPFPREWWGMLKTSEDFGKTWSEAIRLPEDILGPIKNKPVLINGHRLICPSSIEHDGWRVHFEITEDFGKTWRIVGPIDDDKQFNIIQPSILFHDDGRLQMLARSREDYVINSWSADGGNSWSVPEPTLLPNPNSGIDAVTLQNGLQLIVYNNTITEGRFAGPRTPLSVALSEDGTTWKTVLILEDKPGEYSYPAVIQGKDGIVHITYTWNRENIKYVALNSEKLDYKLVSGDSIQRNNMKHLKIYYEPGRFGGWPANHGIWSWGDEILVGFSAAYYMDRGEEQHAVDPDKPEHHILARSLDGGETWELEYPEEQGALLPRGAMLLGTTLPNVEYPPISDLKEPIDFTHPDFAMTFRMEDFRGGGQSRFSYSYDRGKSWNGPYALPLFDTPGIAARTDYLVEGKHELLVFLTAGKSNGLEGRTLCVRTRNGGLNWEFLSWIGPEPDADGYRIMPSSVRLSENEIITTVRDRESDRNLIKAWISRDNGESWEFLTDVAPDVGVGNPPSLIKLRDRRLAVTYAHRGKPYGIRARLSEDNGRTWSAPIIFREDGGNWDIGYTRSVQRPDGKIVTIYYYWDNYFSWDKGTGHERYIAATIWDPNVY